MGASHIVGRVVDFHDIVTVHDVVLEINAVWIRLEVLCLRWFRRLYDFFQAE